MTKIASGGSWVAVSQSKDAPDSLKERSAKHCLAEKVVQKKNLNPIKGGFWGSESLNTWTLWVTEVEDGPGTL